MFIALPLIVFQLIKFVEPALPIRIKNRFLIKVIISSFALALLGASFGFFILVPTSLHFFSGYSTSVIKPLISANEYLSYIVSIIITFALLFQIPLLVLFINYIRPLKPRDLLKYQKHIIIGSFVLAVLLPFTYDPISQFVMAVPIVFLYYFSIFLILVVNHRRKFLQNSKMDESEEVELFETNPNPITAIQGSLLHDSEAVSTVTDGGLRTLEGVVQTAAPYTLAKSRDVAINSSSSNGSALRRRSNVFNDFLPATKAETNQVLTNNIYDLANEVGVKDNRLTHKYPNSTKDQRKTSSIDGFLPSIPFNKIKPNKIKLDDMHSFGVT